MSSLSERRPSCLRLDDLTFRGRVVAFDERGYQPYVEDTIADRGQRIRCPACQWQPPRDTRWWCSSMGPPENFSGGCGHSWNTFDTRGLCPGCRHQWRYTTCLSCNVTSPHDDWYDRGRRP